MSEHAESGTLTTILSASFAIFAGIVIPIGTFFVRNNSIKLAKLEDLITEGLERRRTETKSDLNGVNLDLQILRKEIREDRITAAAEHADLAAKAVTRDEFNKRLDEVIRLLMDKGK